MKQQFLVDKTATIRLTVYDKNRPIVPTSANVTLYKPDGSALQAQAAATVNSTTGEMTYSLTTTHTDNTGLNYKAGWDYLYNSVTYYETQLFDVVKSILSIPITDDDLFAELDSLREAAKQIVGTATAGAAGSITDTGKIKQDDDFWKGGICKIIAGTGVGQERVATGNTQSSGVVTITPNWVTTPDTTSVYKIVQSFSSKIQQSFKKLETMIYDKGKRHELILESSQIEIPLIYLAVHFIALDLMDERDGKWDRIATAYWDKFQAAFNNLTLDYDQDDSGSIAGEEQQHNPSELRIRRS